MIDEGKIFEILHKARSEEDFEDDDIALSKYLANHLGDKGISKEHDLIVKDKDTALGIYRDALEVMEIARKAHNAKVAKLDASLEILRSRCTHTEAKPSESVFGTYTHECIACGVHLTKYVKENYVD